MCVCVCVCDFSSVVRRGEGGGGGSAFVVSGVGSNKQCGVGEASEKVQLVIKKHLL